MSDTNSGGSAGLTTQPPSTVGDLIATKAESGVAKVTAMLPSTVGDDAKSFVSAVRNRKWAQEFRPLNTFAAVTEFSRPANFDDLIQRLQTNLSFFLSNYALICVIILTYAILSKPIVLFVSCILALVWVVVLKEERLPLGGQNKQVLLTVVSVGTVLYFAGSTVFTVVGVCISLVLVHAMFHQASKPSPQQAHEHHEVQLSDKLGSGSGSGSADSDAGRAEQPAPNATVDNATP